MLEGLPREYYMPVFATNHQEDNEDVQNDLARMYRYIDY